MTKFHREKALVEGLLRRLSLKDAAVDDPNAAGRETGIDVRVHLPDSRVIGIQVTEIDPFIPSRTARTQEKAIAKPASR